MPGARPAHYVAGAYAHRLQVAADVSVLTYLFWWPCRLSANACRASPC